MQIEFGTPGALGVQDEGHQAAVRGLLEGCRSAVLPVDLEGFAA